MIIGMLWSIDHPKASLAENIADAATYYAKKYGRRPDRCYVHPSLVTEQKDDLGISIRPMRWIRPGELWIGVGE